MAAPAADSEEPQRDEADLRRRDGGARARSELGPYTELDGLTIERDPRFPVRVTVQFYQATSNGVLAAADVAQPARADQEGLREPRTTSARWSCRPPRIASAPRTGTASGRAPRVSPSRISPG